MEKKSLRDPSKSSSTEQQTAERIVFDIVQRRLNLQLEANPRLYLADNRFTYMEPDFYSESAQVIGEIFAHMGKPKKAQDNKIANDILKMLLLEKITGKQFQKLIVVCDEEEEKKLRGLSVLAESIRQFGIEIMRVDVDDQTKASILGAQSRQVMVNA